MVKRQYRCQGCGHVFVLEVFEQGEAEAKNLPGRAVTCPRCGGGDLKRQ